jgi:hypothetical protein
MNNFDTQPLLNEINDVLKNGFQEILKDYMKRHWLLEETHDKLVNLPSVKQYYGCGCDECKYKPRVEVKVEPEIEIHDTVKEDISKLIQNLDDKINNLWKIHGDYFVKIENKLDEFKNEMNTLKHESKNSTNFSNIEKENIKLEIVDDAINECKIEEDIQVQEELEVEEVEEELEEEVEEVEEEEELESVETETKEPLVEEEEEEEEELIEIEIDDITYCTNNEENGIIYELDKDGNVGNKVGYLKEGDAYFD